VAKVAKMAEMSKKAETSTQAARYAIIHSKSLAV